MSAWTLHLLPTNGLDRSLHAPVLIGLVFVTLFTEAFGWTYAGLVVPGYLAATFAAAPITAVLILVEGWLTHVGVAIIARVVPERTGAWSTAFGRERFFLYIVIAIIVRLFVEGTVVPYATQRFHLAHSRELYSIGLVLVPLVANVFWSSGFLHAGPRLLVLTGLTYLVVDQFLLKHTNFSLSRFQVANESVALHFLDTPKAYLLLLVGAMLGARGNVRYGWDYNGILVPALLAVAWYEPMKLLGTGAEAVGIYLLARFLSSVPPFSRLPLVGPRRMLFVGLLGFLVKLGLGHLLVRVLPRVELTEYLGFGYILPSLLAVKMWNKLRIGIVLMPTLQVSLTAFLVGNALGFVLNWVTNERPNPQVGALITSAPEDIEFTWLLATHAPSLRPGECRPLTHLDAIAAVIEHTLTRGAPDRHDLAILDAEELQVVSDERRWWLVVPKPAASPSCTGLRIALSPELRRRGGVIALRTAVAPYGSPLAVSALAVAEATAAPLVIADTIATRQVGNEPQWVEALTKGFSVLELAADAHSSSRLQIAGDLPNELNLAALERLLESRIELAFVDPRQLTHPLLTLGASVNERIATQTIGYAAIESWPLSLRRNIQTKAEALISRTYRTPTRAELLLLSATVLPALESTQQPSAWSLAVARRLSYRVASAGRGAKKAWVMFEPDGYDRHGNATWIVRPEAPRSMTIEVPAPLWELGTLSYGLALFDALDAKHLLIPGARPNAKADGSSDPRRSAGRISFFQHIHQSSMAQQQDVLAIHAMRPDVPLVEDVVAESTTPILNDEQRPTLAKEVLGLLSETGLLTTHYSAALNQVSIGAQFDPAFAFGERFAPDRMSRLWFSQRARERINRIPAALDSWKRIVDRSPLDVDMAQLVVARLASTAQASAALSSSRCDLTLVIESVVRWLAQNNPYDRLDAKRSAAGCDWMAAIDEPTGLPWLALFAGVNVRLVPLHSARAAAHSYQAERTLPSVRRALDLGTATIAVGPP